LVSNQVQAIIDKSGLGTSKEDKLIKLAIAEKFFLTASKTELELKSYEFLQDKRCKLETFMKGWNKAEDKLKYVEDYIIPADELDFIQEIPEEVEMELKESLL
jgi:hypothetical protein